MLRFQEKTTDKILMKLYKNKERERGRRYLFTITKDSQIQQNVGTYTKTNKASNNTRKNITYLPIMYQEK